MTDHQSTLLSEQKRRQRSAVIVGVIITALGGLLVLWGVVTYKPAEAYRLVYVPFYILLALTGLLDVWMSRRGRSDMGTMIVVALILVIVATIGAILMDNGLLFLMLSVSMVSVISVLALSPRYQFYTIAASIMIGLFVLFFDLYVTASWRRPGLTANSTPIIGGFVLIFFLVFLFFNLRNFSLRA
jgi:hypothetical protein